MTTKKILFAILMFSCALSAQSPSGQGSSGGQGAISQQGSSVLPLSITSVSPLPGATQNVPYLQVLAATGGTACTVSYPYNWTVISGSLPPGMLLGPISGAVEHASNSIGTFTFTVEATDCGGQARTKLFSLTISAAPLPVITTTSPLPSCIVGLTCNDPLVCTGGTPPYTWSQPTGSLPPGCTLPPATGILSCSPPTTSGTYNFTAVCTDSIPNPSNPVALAVTAVCPSISITSSPAWPAATNGQAYSLQLAASGGDGTLAWSLSGQPSGLSVNSSSGLVSGTPTVSGSFTPVPVVTDSCLPTGSTANQNATLTVNNNGLALTNTTPLASGTVGAVLTIPLTAIGGTPAYTYSNPTANLPAGLSISGATITGTPTTSGTYTGITLKVTDSLAATDTGASPYSMVVSCPAISISSSSVWPVATQGQSYSLGITASGGTGTRHWVLSGQPSGLSINSSSGLVSGTPTVAGAFSPLVTVTDSCLPTGSTANQTGSLTVNSNTGTLTLTNATPLTAGTVGTSLTIPLSATGGTPAYTYSNPTANLPAGLSISGATITGTPTTSGTYTGITLKVTDSLAATSTGNSPYSMTVSCPAISISSSASWPAATNGQSYSLQLTASGGTGTLHWSLSGQPTGLSIGSSTGLVSGTPTVSGSFSPVPSVTDSCLPTGSTATQTASLTVNNSGLTLTNTTPLASGTAGIPLTIPLSATGGAPPYSYSNPSSNLPPGLNISGATITGTPTTAGSYGSIHLQVTDSTSATDSGASPYSQSIAATSGDDSRYCNSSGNWTGATADGPALAPINCNYTPLSATPASGPTKTVCPSGCNYTTLQAAANAAACGWIISIQATSTGTPSGTQLTYPGLVTLPGLGCGSNWVWIVSSLYSNSNFPSEGSRISPAWVGITSLPARPAYAQPSTPGIYLPQIINNTTNQPTLSCTGGLAHWRIMGLEFATTGGVNVQNAVVSCNSVTGLILDRNVIHGGNNTTTPGKDADLVSQGVSIDGGTGSTVMNSYIYDIHCLSNTCADSYAINAGGCSTATTGPTKVINNYLEAAGESMVFTGGCGSGPSVVPVVDLEVRRNHGFKPLFWKTTDPSYFGTSFEVKNGFELKNANRVLYEGNINEQTWFGQSDQQGQLMDIGSKNQSNPNYGVASSSGSILTWISGTQFSANLTSSSCATPNHCNVKYNGVGYQAQTVTDSQHLVLTSSPPTTASASYVAFLPGLNPSAIVSNVTIRYSIFMHASRGIEMYAVPSDGGDVSLGTNSISIHDITMDDIDGFHWGSGSGGCCFWSLPFSIQNQAPAGDNMHDIWIFNTTDLPFLSGGSVGAGPALAFGYQSINGTAVTNLKIFNNISAAGWGSGGGWASNCGATPTSTLTKFQCYDNLSGVQQNTFCFDGNVLATTTQGSPSGTGNTPPYPTSLQSPSCPHTPIGNFLPASYAAIGFTNLNGANGGNYVLPPSSTYYHAGSDGNSPGPNIPLVLQYTQGVQ